ncbi:MAG: dUTP diphosphatase [Clostridiales bacterium]|jgi:dUTP pyrophosphatase|nr:dUTP diphosphatase [Clostridia bacterium]NLL35870.1 dUTP diphosphatase [Clostridiales bacterium]HHY06731.1 dUTP diphosphatase [Clostridia bacterium]
MNEARETIEIYFELCHPEAKMPCYARQGDAGMDVYAVENTLIKPGQTVVVRTGWKVALPCGYELQIRPRSGLSLQTPLRVANSPGTIDAGYRDEVGIILQNTSLEKGYEIKKGERVAQLVLQKVPQIKWVLVENVQAIGIDRGGGFGSTGL